MQIRNSTDVEHIQKLKPMKKWVCLKIGYIPNYSHLIGIMISKTIGFRGLANIFRHSQINTQYSLDESDVQYLDLNSDIY